MASTAHQPADLARAERGNRTRNQAELLASSLPPLLVDAERLAASTWLGVHGRRKAGIGEQDRVSIEMWPRRKGFFQSLSGEDDALTGREIRLPARLRTVLSTFEVRERIAADGPVLWAGEF